MGIEIRWSEEEIAEAACDLSRQNSRGFLLDQMLDALTDFSMSPHYEKTLIAKVLRTLGYDKQLIHHGGTKTVRWYRAPKAGSSFLSGGMLQSVRGGDSLSVSPFKSKETARKPLRLPAEKWAQIADIRTELQRLHPEKRVSLHSTVESLIDFALENATITAE